VRRHPGAEIQAKSRQNRVGPFPASKIAEHVSALHSRRSRNQGAAVELVIERDIKERALPTNVTRIGDLPADHPLAIACAQTIESEELPAGAYDEITIRVLSFTDARRETANVIENFFSVEHAVAERIAGDFVRVIAEASDANAEATHATRSGVDRTSLEHAAHRAIAEIDPTALIAAIASGACEPADLDTPVDDDTYFQGLDAQPGHIAAALPAPRRDQVDVLVAGLATSNSVLITGPSGVGKSTLMWMAAYVERHVTWYRVNRLLPEDVEDIYRLAVGHRPSDAAPIGFLVDGVGIGEVEAWDRLVRRLQPLQHVVLMGTVRVEDIFATTTAHLSTRVDVGLDEAVAKRIFNHLRETGHTADVHWREAYDAAEGLTLEYTYQLTQGNRLPAVLGAQVARLVHEGADNELDLLALITTAHMYGVTLAVDSAQRATGLDDGDLRRAIGRLKDEHLVLQDSKTLRGLHVHRSRALSRAVHANPPPTLATTVTRLIETVDDHDLPRLVVGLVRDHTDLDNDVVAGAADRAATGGSELLAALLHAFRGLDFVRHAQLWSEITAGAHVPPAHWPITVTMGLTGTELPESLMQPSIVAAVKKLAAHQAEPTALRDAFVDAVDPNQIADAILAQGNPGSLASLLAACVGGPAEVIEALTTKDWGGSNAETVLQQATAREYAAIGHIANQLSAELAEQLLEVAGGEQSVIERILDHYPTVYHAGREDRDGESVAVANLMYIDDEVTPDPNTRAHDVAKVLLRSLPGCASADISTVRAGDKPFRIGDLTFGESGLREQYSLTDVDVDWNRARTALVLHDLGAMSKATHAATVAALLERAVSYLTALVTAWVTVDLTPGHATWRRTEPQRASLATDADQLTLPLDGLALFHDVIPGTSRRFSAMVTGTDGDDVGAPSVLGADSAHTVLHAIADQFPARIQENKPGLLAARAADLVDTLDELTASERWDLAGWEAPPASSTNLRELFTDMADIATALHNRVVNHADLKRERSGPKGRVITRVADLCRRRIQVAVTQLVDDLSQLLQDRGIDARVLHRPAATNKSYWPPVELAALVNCDHVFDWLETVDTVVETVLQIREGHHLPATFVCPVFNSRPEPLLGQDVLSAAYSLPGAYYEWFPEELSDEATHTLPSDISLASTLLVRCSSLNELKSRRTLAPEHEAIYEAAVVDLGAAIARIEAYGDDECINAILFELQRLAMAVADEGAEGGTPGAVAAELIDLVSGQSQPEHPTVASAVGAMSLAAIQWTHDPVKAIELFELGVKGHPDNYGNDAS